MDTSADPRNPQLSIPIDRLSKFVRQISHDVRNGLNAVDLEATLISEITSEPEVASEARKLRVIVGTVAQSLQQLAGYFAPLAPSMIECPVRELAEAIFERISKTHAGEMNSVTCNISAASGSVVMDFELLVSAVNEIFKNAFQFRDNGAAVSLEAQTENDDAFMLVLIEPKTSVSSPPETWGLEPLVSTRRGGLGLGLYYARQIIAAHGGTLDQSFAEGRLTTRVRLPLSVHGR